MDVDGIVITPRRADLSMMMHVHQPIQRRPVQNPVERRVPEIINEEEGVPYRATYILDDMGIIQHVSVNGLDTGRNHKEIARTLAALKEDGLTGCDWQPGDQYVA